MKPSENETLPSYFESFVWILVFCQVFQLPMSDVEGDSKGRLAQIILLFYSRTLQKL